MENKMNRRGFFTAALKVVGLAAVAPAALNAVLTSRANAQEKRRGESGGGTSAPMVAPNDSVAKAVKYVEDAKKSPEAKGNKCSNCGFYSKKEVKGGKEVGTCTIFAGKMVYGDGFCASWNKKA